jgi:hypothetical protein
VTWGKQLYFPSEGRHAEHFFARKNPMALAGFDPRTWVPEATMLTTKTLILWAISRIYYNSKLTFVSITFIEN